MEVKAGVNTKSKSLNVFREKYKPDKSLLLSAQGTNQTDKTLTHAPVYLAGKLYFE